MDFLNLEHVGINGFKQEGGELFVKIFSKKLDKNEVLTTITEKKLFAKFQSVETSF